MTAAHVVVVGGGISGLAAAHRLLRDDPDVRVTLLEARPRLGGVVHTVREDGLVMEEGPDLFLGAKPGGWDLARELGIAGRLHGTREGAGGSFLLSRGALHRLPDGLTGLVPTKVMPFVTTSLLSPLGKLRVAAEPFILPRRDDEDESVRSFVVRRLGREMYERIIEPLLSGIFGGDGSKLSVLATFPHLRAAERASGGMTRAMLAARRRARRGKGSRAASGTPAASGGGGGGGGRRPDQYGFLSFPGGQREMVEALERALTTGEGASRASVRTSAPVARVAELLRGGWRVSLAGGEAIDADALILALPSYASAELLADVDPACANAMRGIEYAPMATVNVAFRRGDVPHALDGTGWTTPRAERRPVLACTWSSSKFANRAPEGVALFRAFVGGATNHEVVKLSDDELVGLVREELRLVLGVTAEPVKVRVTRIARAMPQYDLGHLGRVAFIEERVAAHRALAVAGGSYRAVGLPDVIRSGVEAATRILLGVRPEGVRPPVNGGRVLGDVQPLAGSQQPATSTSHLDAD